MVKRRGLLLTAGALVLLPSAAWANMGTPLMWANILHLGFGNAVIGVIEGLLISRWFAVDRGRAIRLMIAANYTSAWVGVYTLTLIGDWLHSRLVSVPLYDTPRMIMVMALVIYLATVIMEYPFCIWILRSRKTITLHLFRRALLASFGAQTLSYGLLILYYLPVSSTGIYNNFDIDRQLSFARGSRAVVYFISPQGDVCRINADGTHRRTVVAKAVPDEYAWLFVRKSPKTDSWDLWVRAGWEKRRILHEFAKYAAPRVRKSGGQSADDDAYPRRVADLRPDGERDWEIENRFRSSLSMRAHRPGQSLGISFETPFGTWQTYCATILLGDLLVFQMKKQILVLDLNKRKVGFLALGHGPVVGME